MCSNGEKDPLSNESEKQPRIRKPSNLPQPPSNQWVVINAKIHLLKLLIIHRPIFVSNNLTLARRLCRIFFVSTIMKKQSLTPVGRQATRRDFLKTSALLASAAALGHLDISQSAHAAGSDTLRVGMIGCGGRNGGAIMQALTADPGARLVAMCDIFMDRIQAQRENVKKNKPGQMAVDDDHCFPGFDGYKKVIESSDVVLIANAAKFHPFHAKAAIEAGKHVFVEKPHGIDPAGIKTLKAACELAKEKKLCIV
jgi:hypothetical protein